MRVRPKSGECGAPVHMESIRMEEYLEGEF